MTFIATLFSALIATAGSFIQVDDFAKQKSEAYRTMYSVAPDPTKLIFAGEMDELSKQIQAIFPVDKRTAVEALVLGDALFGFDPQASYRLHKEAFEKNPNNEYIQFEWAMEQHRRGEYAAAIEGYQFYLRKDPQFAPAFGLLAECLMRTGKIELAVKAWEDSEAAPQGTLERLERYVYELHTPVPAEIVRAEIIKRVKKGDLDAAEELIAYDCAFPKDWWNINRATPLLKVDLEIIRTFNFPPSERLNQLIGIAEANASEEKVDLIPLEKLGLVTEEQSTLPLSNGSSHVS
jgi:tetratricopeptide (TPR) repeat protein